MTAHRFSRRGVLAAGLSTGLIAMPGLAQVARGKSLSQALAEAIVALRSTPLRPDIAERAAWTLLDGMGAMLHGAAQPSVRRSVAAFADRRGTPAASIVGHRVQAPVELAAAANAYLLHAEEVDDSDLPAQLRASAVILPTALAMAEALDLSGAQFLANLALGLTLQRRLAAPLGPTQPLGWMASGVWGPPAAAAMAAAMAGLDVRSIASALALGGSGSGGSFQYFYDQTEEKRLIVARGARTAVESARLAALGETGAARILEGQAGLYRLIGGAAASIPTAAQLTAGLADRDGPLFLQPKYFAASSSVIPTLDGLAADLPAGFDAEQIVDFTVRGNAGWARVLADKVNGFTPPQSRIGASTNFSFMVALYALRRSALPDDLTPAALADARILALAKRGRFVVADVPDIVTEFTLRDGRIVRTVARTPPPGQPVPFEQPRRIAKFDALTARAVNQATRERVRAACLSVGQASSMRSWAAIMRQTVRLEASS